MKSSGQALFFSLHQASLIGRPAWPEPGTGLSDSFVCSRICFERKVKREEKIWTGGERGDEVDVCSEGSVLITAQSESFDFRKTIPEIY